MYWHLRAVKGSISMYVQTYVNVGMQVCSNTTSQVIKYVRLSPFISESALDLRLRVWDI